MEQYCSDLFLRIDSEKQERIYEISCKIFSGDGFANANINTIAKEIGISVGSLYKYFQTKENLFLYCVQRGRQELDSVLSEIEKIDGDIFEKLTAVITTIQKHSRDFPHLINLYNEITTEGNLERAKRLSDVMESLAINYYTKLIRDAQNSGEISSERKPELLALLIDNLFMNLQFSYSNNYYKERMKLFVGDMYGDDSLVKEEIIQFIRDALK